MNKKIQLIAALLVASASFSSVAYANQHTFSVGYIQNKIKDYKSPRGINLQYRYEWNSPLSVVGSFSYASSKSDVQLIKYKFTTEIKMFSFLMGPAYRVNNYVSVYALAGMINGEAKLKFADILDDSYKDYTLAYGVGVIVNPIENISVNIGYQGARLKNAFGWKDENLTIKGFNIGIGYRF